MTNRANSANVQYNGEWIKNDDTWEYEPGASAYIDVQPSTTYVELLDKLYDELEVDRCSYDLVVRVMYKLVTKRNIPYVIKKDKDVKLFVEENCISKEDRAGYIPLCVSIVQKASAIPLAVQKTFDPVISQRQDLNVLQKERDKPLDVHESETPVVTNALKLVGDAQGLLLDSEKGRVHDLNCKNLKPCGGPSQQQEAGNRTQPWAQNPIMARTTSSPFTNFYPQQHQPQPQINNPQQQQQPQKASRSTFWTMCPYCEVKYEFYREVLNSNLFCQWCKGSFTGHEIKDQAKLNQPLRTQLKPGSFNNGAKVGTQISPSFDRPQAQAGQSVAKTGTSSGVRKYINVELNGKRKKRIDIGESESCDSDDTSESEEEEDIVRENGDMKVNKDDGCVGDKLHRSRSTPKTNIFYIENISGDDDCELGKSSKKAKFSGSPEQEAQKTKLMEEGDLQKGGNFKRQAEKSNVGSSDLENRVQETETLGAQYTTERIKTSSVNAPEIPKQMGLDSKENSNSSKESPEVNGIPEPEFFNFNGEKSEEKFRSGQFWAMYSDEDGLPKYYAVVKEVVCQPEFKISVNWLTPCSSENNIRYADKKMPISCGVFKYSSFSEATFYTNTTSFSHRLKVEPTSQRNEVGIYPKTGEVWAVYKRWYVKTSRSGLQRCEYDLLEILGETDIAIRVAVLERVNGFSSVFKACGNEGSLVVSTILRSELLKFSHQIPAFRLMNERGGTLKWYLELDPAAVPLNMLQTGTPENATQRKPKKKKENTYKFWKPNAYSGSVHARWDSRNTEIFLEACVAQIRSGNRGPHYLSNKGWDGVLETFYNKTKIYYYQKQLRNRWDVLKQEFVAWSALSKGATGLRWNATRGTWDAPDHWWDEMTQRYKFAKRFKDKGLEHTELLDVLFGGSMATGECQWTPAGYLPSNVVEHEADAEYISTPLHFDDSQVDEHDKLPENNIPTDEPCCIVKLEVS